MDDIKLDHKETLCVCVCVCVCGWVGEGVVGWVWTEFIWLRIGTSNELL